MMFGGLAFGWYYLEEGTALDEETLAGAGGIKVVTTTWVRNVSMSPQVINTTTVSGGESTQVIIIPTEVKLI